MDRRTFLKRGAAAASAIAASRYAPAPAGQGERTMPPNILLILADDLGYGDLASYGAPDLRTPHVDGLLAGGMRLDRFYANSPVCSPTRAAILTGRYPALVGVPGVIRTHANNSWGHLAADAVLLPQVLRKAGYHTALVGKWHLGLASPDTPTERGFDHFHGFLGDMMDDYYTHRRHGNNYMRLEGREIDPEGHATDLFSRWAAEYVRERARAGGPWLLYLGYNAPHVPTQPPPEWLARVKEREPGTSDRRARLVALIEHMDDGIGQVLAALKETGQDRSTLVVFTSDNGGDLAAGARNGPLRSGKGTMYEGGLAVPAGAAWPGRIAPGGRSDRVALTMDLFPTLAEAAGAAGPAGLDGRSLLPTLLGRPQPPEDRFLFFTRLEAGMGGKTIDAVRRGDWKLLRNKPAGPLELYNLKDDPQEKRNRLAGGERPPVADELDAALQDQLRKARAVPWQPPA